MPLDFTKFPFPGVHHPDAATLTEAIRADPVPSGFAVITLKSRDPAALLPIIRDFVRSLWAGAAATDLVEITLYRQLRRDELGGLMPFDGPVCEGLLQAAQGREPTREAAGMVSSILLANRIADWVMLVQFKSPERALDAVRQWAKAEAGFDKLAAATTQHTLGAFRNMMRYATVLHDPGAIQFFNLFPSPGDLDVLWKAWQDALPWFFEVAEIRSSFPLLALDRDQPLLLVNHAHCDSVKHFLIGTLYEPGFRELMASCYARRNVTLPMPFFCKVVPV